ncbi:MAG: AAA family ATPase [Bacteroides sp.]|nr:AAA family ATPase [Bacteroides sp.]
MRFRKLSIRNIASLEEAEIDFTRTPLKEARLFLICGPTGAGKSTILDAIALALYGTAPRLSAVGRKRALEENDTDPQSSEIKSRTLQFNSATNLVRRGASEAWVRLDFEGNDRQEYRAEFLAQYYAKKSKNAKKGDLRNVGNALYLLAERKGEPGKEETVELDQPRCLATKITEFNNLISSPEVVGMEFEQFCRTSLLAQGAFNAFLNAEPNQKSEILEKITGIERFTEFGTRVHETYIDAQRNWRRLADSLGNVSILSEEARAAIIEKTAALTDKDIPALARKKSDIEEGIKWLDLRTTLEKETADARENYDRMQKKDCAEETILMRRKIRSRKELAPFRMAQERVGTISGELRRIGDEYSFIRGRLAGLISYAAILEKELDGEKGKLKDCMKHREELRDFDSLLEKRELLMLNLDQTDATRSRRSEFLSEKERKEGMLSEKRREGGVAEERTAKLDKEIERNEETLRSLDLQLKERNLDNLELKREGKGRLRANMQVAAERLHDYGAKCKEFLDIMYDLFQNEKLLTETEKAELDDLNALKNAEEEESKARETRDRTKVSVGGAVRALRHDLRAGNRCPVCHSEVMEVLPDAFFEEALRPLEEALDICSRRVATLKEKSELSKRQTISLRATLEADRKRKDKIHQEEEICRNKCIEAINLIGEAPETPYGALSDPNAWEDKIREAIEILDENISALDNDIKEGRRIRKEREEIAETVRRLTTERQKNATSVAEMKNVCAKLEEQISNASANISREEQRLSDLKKELGAFRWPEKGTAPEELIANGISRAIFSRDENLTAQETGLLRGILNRLHSMVENFEDVAERLGKGINEREGLLTNLSNEERAAAGYIATGGEILEKLGIALISTDIPVEREKGEVTGKEWEGFAREVASWHSRLEARKADLDEAVGHQRKMAEGFDADMLSDPRCGMTDVEAELKEKELEALALELTQALTLLEERENRHRAHLKSIPPILGNESETAAILPPLSALLSETEERYLQLLSRRADLENQLKRDDEERQRSAGLRLELKEAEKRKNMLETLNLEFGKEKFKNIAASYILAHLLEKGNFYMERFSNRYRMVGVSGSLEVMVLDRESGERRPYNTLSGGETFMVSLALALGLAAMQNSRVTPDTLFIDEGFGTLSGDVLETVMETLERLQRLEGRRVGIISHVERLRERIEVLLTVERRDPTTSAVIIKSL